MLGRLFGRGRETAAIATSLYGVIVAQARRPALYAAYGVPDTVTGRFEMVVLHLTLALGRLDAGGPAEKAIGQALFDLYCSDMDNSLRELGFGDFGVPPRMKKMSQAFYGRAKAYRSALSAGDDAALAAALGRNVFPDAPSAAVDALAAYVRASFAAVAATPLADLSAGTMSFADPEAFAPANAPVEATP